MSFTDLIRAAAKAVPAAAISLFAIFAHAEESDPLDNPTKAPALLSTTDLEERGITSLDVIAAAVPGISYTRALNSLSTLSLYMRGEGPVAPGQITLDGAVGLYQDGFYISRLQANTFALLDLERVQVLDGPQGALYGRDTTGGVINLISQAPTGKLNFGESVDFGNRNSYSTLSSLDTPTWHDLAAKVTLLASSIDGYVKNELVNSHDYGSEKRRAARLQLLWDGLSNLRAEYSLERGALDSTPEYVSNPSQNGREILSGYVYYADPSGPMHSTYRPVNLPLSTSNHTAQGLTLTWRAFSALTVQSLTGYRTMNANEQQDYAEYYGFPAGSVDLYQQHQFSQDLRFSGDLFARQVGYVAGLSYFRERGAHSYDFLLLSNGQSQLTQIDATSRSQAAYVQLRWRPSILGQRLELMAADRYTRDSKDARRSITDNVTDVLESNSPNHLSYNRATPEISLSYRWTTGFSSYVKVATAYQAGGALESAPPNQFASNTLRPETSTTYEAGVRSAFMDDRLRATVAVFDSRRKDVQYALPANVLTDEAFEFQRVTVRGANFELQAAPLRDLTFAARATYLHWSIDRAAALAGTVFDPSTGSGSPYVVGENIKGVFALPYTPKYSASVAGDYTFLHLDRRDVMLHLDYVYRARMFAEAGAGPAIPGALFATQPAYGLLNGRLTMSQETDWSHRLKFSVWGRNVLNRKYYQPALGVGNGVTSFDTSGSAPVQTGYTSTAGAWAEPRAYGLNIRFEY
jgi:iron complex outermembrane receptor protein